MDDDRHGTAASPQFRWPDEDLGLLVHPSGRFIRCYVCAGYGIDGFCDNAVRCGVCGGNGLLAVVRDPEGRPVDPALPGADGREADHCERCGRYRRDPLPPDAPAVAGLDPRLYRTTAIFCFGDCERLS